MYVGIDHVVEVTTRMGRIPQRGLLGIDLILSHANDDPAPGDALLADTPGLLL